MGKVLGLFLTGLLTGAAQAAESKPRAAVDVVFVIDTTSSMGGLLEAAKTKVWAIANEIAKGKPTPEIRMGLVAFRDRGDAYLTQVTDLTKDLDKMYGRLLALRPEGGGDGPEHVLQGLADASEKISWSKDPKTFKVLYLVGDAPAHEDYNDTKPLAGLVQDLVKKGVVLNTIQCGSGGSTQEQWSRIASLGEGRYAAISHDGGVAASDTPFDARLSELSGRLDGTALAFGERRREAEESASAVRGMLAFAAPAAKADRAAFRMSAGAGGKGAFPAESDLLAAVEDKRVDLGKVKDEELPPALRGKDAEGRRKALDKVRAERETLKKEIAQVAKEREAWRAKNAGTKKDAFDAKLVEALKAQAGRKGIAY
ncbi:MAG: VWA domain-containing protein [Elusimicrobia bacterium]|nr:VWA domain-containing protein [Elusimicrobiota bacterium]